jgi:hypothetical protein
LLTLAAHVYGGERSGLPHVKEPPVSIRWKRGWFPERCMGKVQALPITGIETCFALSLYTGAARKAKGMAVGNDGTETGSTVVYKRWHTGTLNPDKQKTEGLHDDLSRYGACFSFADCTNMHCRQPSRSWGLEVGWALHWLWSHWWWREAYLHQVGIEPRLTISTKVPLEIADTDSSTVPLGVSGTTIIFALLSIGLAVSWFQLTVVE